MTAKEIIELHIQGTAPQYASGDKEVGLDTADPDVLFKHQLVKGKSFKRDALRTKAPRDLNFNSGGDMSSNPDKPWF